MKVVEILEAEKEDVAPAPAEEPTHVLKDTAEVGAYAYPYLVAKIEKLNKRARKNKLPEIKLEIVKEYMKKKKDTKLDPDGNEFVEIPYYTVKVSGDAPKVAGYKFIATIEHQEGGNIIRTVPGEEGNDKIKAFYEAKPHYCDHCKKIRKRIDTFIVKEEATGKLRQIGRNCLADFLGGADPKAILWYFDNRDAIIRLAAEAEERGTSRGGRVDEFMPLDRLLTIAAAMVREFGYMSSKKAQEAAARGEPGMPTTAGDLRWVLFARHDPKQMSKRDHKMLDVAKNPTPADEKQVKDILAWFATIPEEQKQANEFMHNLDVIVKSGKVNPRNIGFAVALFPTYARAMDMIKQKADAPKKSNEKLGTIGQKLPPTKIKVIRTRMISGQFGSTQIVSMEDPKGNTLVWFNNGQNRMEDGKEYTITGTVKKHDVFNGKNQTHLTRVKAQ